MNFRLPAHSGLRNRTMRICGPLIYPSLDPLSPLVIRSKALEIFSRSAVPSTGSSLERLVRRAASAAENASRDFPGLKDELGDCLDEILSVDDSEMSSKLQAEFATYSAFIGCAGSTREAMRHDLVNVLVKIHRGLGTGTPGFRSVGAFVKPDAAGNRIEFPHPGMCLPLIEQLELYLRQNLDRSPALCAMAAYTAIIHAHPFDDGNGRTARTFYNIIMAAAAGSRHFAAIRRIATLRHGSFLIKLRRALYAGDWSGLQAFFTDATRLSAMLQSAGGLSRFDPTEATSSLPPRCTSNGRLRKA